MRIRQLAVALVAGAVVLSLAACGSAPSPAAGPESIASQLRSPTAAHSRAVTATPATRSSGASSATGTVLMTVTVTERTTTSDSSTSYSSTPTESSTVQSSTSDSSTPTESSMSTPGQITSPRGEPNAPGTRTTQSDPSLKVLPGSVAPGKGGAPTGTPITTSTTMFQPENNQRTDPISTAAAFVSLYANRQAGDSRAQNFSKRVAGFVTPQVQAQLDTESLTAPVPEYGQTIGIITTANIMEFPKPTTTTASVFVLYTSRTAMKEQLVGQVAGIGKYVAVTKQKDGTWIVSGLRGAAN